MFILYYQMVQYENNLIYIFMNINKKCEIRENYRYIKGVYLQNY